MLPDGVVRWAVVGVGDITKARVFPAIQADSRNRLRAVVTRNPERSREVCERFGAERICGNLEEALSDPQVDAVYVATPVSLHYAQTMASLEAGKHVLCEKPTAMGPKEVEAMIATAKAADRLFGVSFYRRLFPVLARVRELMREGVIGQPIFAWVCHHAWNNEEILAHRAWLFDPAHSGGGPLMDVGSHRIDLLNYLFGEPRLTGAGITRQTQNTPGFHVEDSATLTMEYNGEFGPVRAVMDARWNSKVFRDEFRVIGTEGELDVMPLNSGKLRYPGGEELHPPHDNFHLPMLRHFVDALVDGVPLISSGETAIWTDRMMAEAYSRR